MYLRLYVSVIFILMRRSARSFFRDRDFISRKYNVKFLFEVGRGMSKLYVSFVDNGNGGGCKISNKYDVIYERPFRIKSI